MQNQLSNIGNTFLDALVSEIKSHLQEITCGEICSFYSDFSNKLKEIRGTSSDFTGLSELIIFRTIHSYLEATYKTQFNRPEPYIDAAELKIFRFNDHDISIGQCIPVEPEKKKPDIGIWKGKSFQRGVEIKTYVGTEQVKETLNRMVVWHQGNPNFKGLFIVFYALSDKSKILTLINEQKELHKGWLTIEFLQNNDKPFAQILGTFLLDLLKI